MLHTAASALDGIQADLDILKWGWYISEDSKSMPVLDTTDNMKKVDILRQSIMHKCACKTSAFDHGRKYCKCVNSGRVFSVLCKCIGCKNTQAIKSVQKESVALDDISSTSSSSLDSLEDEDA